MSTALVAGLLGLFGTVLGAGLTTWTMRQTAARSDERAWLENRRQEFRSAVTQFASALLVYRLAEGDRWAARRQSGKNDETAEREAYRQRAAMLDALYVLELSSDSDQLKKLARSAVDMAHHIRKANNEDEMGRRTHDVRDALEQVIAAARRAEPGRFRPGEAKD
jgi:hypothetical protein